MKGYSKTKTYNSWRKMMERCYNPNQRGYKNFGGKGIGVVPEWWDYLTFLEDMGERFKGGTVGKGQSNVVLDRIFIDLDYGPENCRWSTRQVQAHNQARQRANFRFGLAA